MREAGTQTTRLAEKDALLRYARDPANGVWIAPVGSVAEYIRSRRAVSSAAKP